MPGMWTGEVSASLVGDVAAESAARSAARFWACFSCSDLLVWLVRRSEEEHAVQWREFVLGA